MVGELPDFNDRHEVEVWLRDQPRGFVVLFAARAAARVLPLLARARSRPGKDRLADIFLPCARAISVSTCYFALGGDVELLGAIATKATDLASDNSNAEGTSAAATFAIALAASTAAYVDADVAATAAADTASAASNAAVFGAVLDTEAALHAATAADSVIYLEKGLEGLAASPLWLSPQPQRISELWLDLRKDLLAAGDGWEVWADWYDARLRGGPIDWSLERAIVLIPNSVWTGDPKELNARVAELIAARTAALPQGEVLDVASDSAQIASFPLPEDDPNVVADAVARVEDALEDFREDGLDNRVPELKATVRRLDRALRQYRGNPRRLHDDFNLAALEIGREMGALGDLGDDTRLVVFRDTCAQSTIDLRIGVKAVAELVAERFKHQSRMPPLGSRQAYRFLLQENEQTIDSPLAEEIAQDLEILERSGVAEGELIIAEDARDAFYRLATRLAWLIRFGSMRPEQIVELARRVGRSVDEIERLVAMYRLGEIAWELVSFILKLF